jgi:hypothetical protein
VVASPAITDLLPALKPPPCTQTMAGRRACWSPVGWYRSRRRRSVTPFSSGAAPYWRSRVTATEEKTSLK